MRTLLRLTLALALAVSVLGPGVTSGHAQEDDAPDYQDDAPDPEAYDEALSPHGDWVEARDYGRVWRPWVSVDWQPYLDGYWAWSRWGWLWVSYEPFGWTYHYGRWVVAPTYGWVWAPGTVWGPAWVDWYWGYGYVGWAPLPLFGAPFAAYDRFVFVPAPYFCSRTVVHHVVPRRRVPHGVAQHWARRDARPPERHRVERVARHPIREIQYKPAATLAPKRAGRGGTNLRAGEARDGGRGVRGGTAPRRDERAAGARVPREGAVRGGRPVDPGRSRPNLGRPDRGMGSVGSRRPFVAAELPPSRLAPKQGQPSGRGGGEARPVAPSAPRPAPGFVRPGFGVYVGDAGRAPGAAGPRGGGASGAAPHGGTGGSGGGRGRVVPGGLGASGPGH